MPEIKREFKKKLLVKELIKNEISPADLANIDEDWELRIKVLNMLLIKGAKFSPESDVKILNKFMPMVEKVFL